MQNYRELCNTAVQNHSADDLVFALENVIQNLQEDGVNSVLYEVFTSCRNVAILQIITPILIRWNRMPDDMMHWILYRLCVVDYIDDITLVVKLIMEYRSNIAQRVSFDALYMACEHNNVNLIRLLIHHGADIHHAGPFSAWRTPLFVAMNELNLDVADLLIECGAEMSLRVTPNHTLVRQRRHCRAAQRALSIVLLKKKMTQKDTTRYMIGPMVWATRLDPVWERRAVQAKRTKK